MGKYKDSYNDDYSETEWNSNKFIILRIHQTVLKIRQAIREVSLIDAKQGLTDLYVDISPKLTNDEKKIWNVIKNIKVLGMAAINSENALVGISISEDRVWPLIDEILLKLVEYADKHGLWMSDKDDLDGL